MYLFLKERIDITRAARKDNVASTRIYVRREVRLKEGRSLGCFRLPGIYAISSWSILSGGGRRQGCRQEGTLVAIYLL